MRREVRHQLYLTGDISTLISRAWNSNFGLRCVLTLLDKVTKKLASHAFYTDSKQRVFQDVKFLSMTHCLPSEGKANGSENGTEFYSVRSGLNANAVAQR